MIQSLANYAPSKIISTIKSITARHVFAECPEIKKKLLGELFWSDRYFVSTVGKHNNENAIQEYVRNQGKQDEYKQLALNIK